MISLKKTLRKILEEKKHNDESLAEAFHGCWHVKVYSDGSAIRSGYPTPAELLAVTPYYEGVIGMRQSTAGDTSSPASYWEPWGLYNYYTAWFTCYVYVKEAKTISTTYYADDHSSMYLNNVQIKTAATCVSTPVTMDLLAGWNKIDFIYSEGAGGSGVYFTPRIETLVEELLPCRFGYINGFVPAATGTQYHFEPITSNTYTHTFDQRSYVMFSACVYTAEYHTVLLNNVDQSSLFHNIGTNNPNWGYNYAGFEVQAGDVLTVKPKSGTYGAGVFWFTL